MRLIQFRMTGSTEFIPSEIEELSQATSCARWTTTSLNSGHTQHLSFLLDHLPPHMHLVISTRADSTFCTLHNAAPAIN